MDKAVYKTYKNPTDNPWNNLSMADKAAMMEVAIRNGITTLPEIRNAYNEFAKGGNLYPDGGYVRSTNDHPVAFDSEGNLVDQVTGETGTMRFPEIILTADPDDVARGRAQRWYKDFGTESNDATSVADGRRQNSHLDERGAEGATKAAGWAKDHPALNTIGLGLSAAPFAVASYPAAVGGGELLGTALTNPYVDAGLTSYFGAHGLNHAINEGITDWKDGVMTALEVTPLGRLVRPLYNAGKEGLQYAVKAADNTARYVSPSYDLYRTIGETTPRTTPTLHSFYSSDLTGSGFVENVYTGSPLFEFGQTIRTSPEKAYFMRAPKDVDVLKLGNGQFRHEVVGNEILPSGEVNGKFVSYGEPWQEFALGENSALYEFPVGPRRGPSLMATDWKGRGKKYSVDEVYEYMQQEEALRKELASIKETMGDDFLKQYSTIRRNLINEKYHALKEHIDTSVYGANQTVIPNERWNFDKFLKTPFWKYTENPTSGQVQKELMMRWPEAKPFEAPTIEWADAARTPQITAENAASITPEQWTALQDAAIARGDMAEAQRLRDLHFKVSAPDTKTVNSKGEPVHNYHGTTNTFTAFDPQKIGSTTGDRSGFFFTDNKAAGKFYSRETGSAWNNLKLMLGLYKGHKPQVYDVYLNATNPMVTDFHGGVDKIGREILAKEAIKNGNDANVLQNIIDGPPALSHNVTIIRNPKHIKSADAVTYDDNGVRIPLGKRDNFKINDIRYGLLPFLGLGTASALYRSSGNENAYGGNLYPYGGTKKQAFLTSLDKSLKEDNRFDNAQWRQFFTDLANMESGYSPNITNSIGAKGYFQLMPFNRAKAWKNPTQQFHEMYKLTGNNLNYLNKNLTKEDWKRADALGIDMYGMLAGAHLGGAGNVLKALRGKGNAKDMNGTSVMKYMTKFSQKGSVPTLATPTYYEDTPTALFTPSNPEVFFGGYKAPEIEAPLPSVELDDAPQYSEEEIARQERRERLNNLSMLMSLTSPQGSSNSMLDALGLLMR